MRTCDAAAEFLKKQKKGGLKRPPLKQI